MSEKMMSFNKIGIIGAGAWGTAIAQAIANAGCQVKIWSYEQMVADEINQFHENRTYLSGVNLNENITASAQMDDVLDVDALMIVTPAQYMGDILQPYVDKIANHVPLIVCSKGIEIKTGRLLSQIINGLFPSNPIGVMCGPSFAIEVAKGLPTALTLAMPERYQDMGYELCQRFSTSNFRLYLNDDIIGAQVGAALKNIIAIACGIATGRELGDNTRAAIITRGLAEIKRFGLALGADQATFSGLSGVGDLVLTCNAMQSRNFSLGVAIGQGQSLAEIMAERNTVSEGVHTAKAVMKLADQMKIDMPISRAVNETLSGQKTIEHAIKGLLERPVTVEE